MGIVSISTVAVNVGRCFLLGGGALVLDDLPDVHGRVDSMLNWLKAKAGQGGKILSAVQLVTGAVSFYLFVSIALAMNQDASYITIANLVVLVSVLITSITSLIFVKRKVWLKIQC